MGVLFYLLQNFCRKITRKQTFTECRKRTKTIFKRCKIRTWVLHCTDEILL